MYVCEKNIAYVEFATICGFRHPLGVWNSFPGENGGGGAILLL